MIIFTLRIKAYLLRKMLTPAALNIMMLSEIYYKDHRQFGIEESTSSLKSWVWLNRWFRINY